MAQKGNPKDDKKVIIRKDGGYQTPKPEPEKEGGK